MSHGTGPGNRLRRANPYSHWLSGLAYELAAFTTLLLVLGLIAFAAQVFYGAP